MVPLNVKEAVLAALKELIVPEIQGIKREQGEIKVALNLTNKRLDDINAHLVDQSRRIDDTNKRIDETNQRIAKVHADLIQRIDKVYADLIKRIDVVNQRIDETNQRIDKVHADLIQRIDVISQRIDETNHAMIRLSELSVSKEDFYLRMTDRMIRLEKAVEELQKHQAA